MLSAARSKNLKSRIDKNLELAHSNAEKDYRMGMEHAFDLSITFSKLDTGPSESSSGKSKNELESPVGKNKDKGMTKHGSSRGNLTPTGGPGNQGRTVPICFFPAFAAKAKRNYIRNCPVATDKKRRTERKDQEDRKADGKASNTHDTDN